jgi:hypothetical protein
MKRCEKKVLRLMRELDQLVKKKKKGAAMFAYGYKVRCTK